MGAMLGVSQTALASYGHFLHQYDRMVTRLEHELDQVHERRLGPALMTCHVQLALRNWLVTQFDAGETVWVDALDFSQGLSMLVVQNNLMCPPPATKVPDLLALYTTPRAPAPAHWVPAPWP
jgi:hypothetical protein